MAGIVTFKTNEPQFSAMIKKFAEAAMITFDAAFEAQGRELCNRLIKLTPPFSGQSIKRGLWHRDIEHLANYKAILVAENQGDMKKAFEAFSPFRDPEIEDMSARQVGERRVEKDIRRVIKGVRGATMPRQNESPVIIISQTNPRSQNQDVQVDWGVRQKCQGKDAIRIYADRSGNVYGVDTEKFLANPSNEDLAKVHQEHRGKRGRVTTAGSKDIIVGRWRWLNIVVAPFDVVQAFIAKKQKMVGQGRGGWAAGFIKLGGKISTKGWVGRHANAGTCDVRLERGNVNIKIVNNSRWASNGDPDRIIETALAGRARDLEKLIQLILEKRWGKGAAGYDTMKK